MLFDCSNDAFPSRAICEVDSDGTNFRTVLTEADSPQGLPDTGALHHPDYAPDGSIVFEGDWGDEQIWRLPVGESEPVKVTEAFYNDNSPCVLPDGRIASLWLDRPGGSGNHEIKVMNADGSDYILVQTSMDVFDIGIGCGIDITDTDGDGRSDYEDNCTLVGNAAQRDTDGDNFGNRCDADFDNNVMTGFSDVGYLKAAYAGTDPHADLDGNGGVAIEDLDILEGALFTPPGPSGYWP